MAEMHKNYKFNIDDKWTTSHNGNSSDNNYTKLTVLDIDEISNDFQNVDGNLHVIKMETSNFEDLIKYRAEGNANIVLALMETSQVLRFKKMNLKEFKTGAGAGSAKPQSINGECDEIKELENFIVYVQLLTHYFSNYFIQIPKIFYLDLDDLQLLNEFLLQYRPVGRINKVIGTKYGLLFPDATFLPKKLDLPNGFQQTLAEPTYCVEIKPKQGWMFDDDFDDSFLSDTDERMSPMFNVKKCRYCLMQYYKLLNSQIDNISSYCPIDLFSGVPERMKNAIRGLIKYPQNNFRIFRDGEIVYGEQSHKMEFHNLLTNIFRDIHTEKKRKHLFINLLEKTLTKDYSLSCDNNIDICTNYKDRTLIHFRSCKYDPNANHLPRNCALKKIFDAQLLVQKNFHHLENFNLNENVSNMYQYHQEFYSLFQEYSNVFQQNQPLREYMIGATALDCQLMITFQKIPSFQAEYCSTDPILKNHVISVSGTTFLTNVTIMDLDPKSLKHFNKYKTQYRQTKLAFLEFLQRGIK